MTADTIRLLFELVGPFIGAAVVYYIRSVDKKLDAQDARHGEIGKKLSLIDDFMRNEIRALDVRLTVVETHLKIK